MLTAEENMKVVHRIAITLTTSRRARDSLGLKPNTSKREEEDKHKNFILVWQQPVPASRPQATCSS